MLKNRLYYQDPYCKIFTSRIVKNSQDIDGNWTVVLENTAFYPTGGGQPHDIGTLNGIPVLNVEEVNGEIHHFTAEKVDSDDEVEGVLNWKRRFDHMQQHTGQHILTAAFVELFDFPTVSFHLGIERVSIDLDVEDLTEQQIDRAEKLANTIILENRPIETKWITEDELDAYDLRKQVAVSGDIRLVIIPDFDTNGCGGTHPSTTGQVLAIKVLSTEKNRGKTRVNFVCGERVLNQLHQKTKIVGEATRLLSAAEEGIPVAIERMLETNHQLERALKESNEALLSFEVESLLNNQVDGIVKAVFQERTVQELQQLARMIVTKGDGLIILLVAENENRLQFVAARGASVETSMKQIASTVLPLLNGKGGGNDSFVQGGGEQKISAVELLKAMEATMN